MPNLPQLISKEQLIGDFVDGFLARVPQVNDLNRQSVLNQFIRAWGNVTFRATASLVAMVDALSVDRATGEALQRLARDRNVPILSDSASSGTVAITDLSFQKIATTIYAGLPAPVAGSLTIYVTDASLFTSTGGSLYIGRGTTNVEGPLTYTAVTSQAGGAYWAITLNGTTPTTKFHNIGETVVFAQGGNRIVNSGTVVRTSQGSSVTSVQFTTTQNATIPDGEVTVNLVPVICSATGPIGNVPAGAISQAVGLPFNASVYNSQAYSNGLPADTENDIRQRIKEYELAKAKGVPQAIRLAAIDVVAPDEKKKVSSANVIQYTDNSAALVFDDGTGYEALFTGNGYEVIVDSALGGEKDFQLRQRPVAQARVENNTVGPYNMANNSYLTVKVGTVTTQHQFHDTDFQVPASATPFEIISSINGNPNINFLAATANDDQNVVVYPRDPSINAIEVFATDPNVGIDSNEILGFPLEISYTIRLYKNDLPLNQDGFVASVDTRLKSTWSSSIAPGDTLEYTVDGTPSFTITLTNAAFQKIDQSATVSVLTDITIWAAVFDSLMPGVSSKVVGEVVEFTSNLEENNSASIQITGGTLKDKIFNVGAVVQAVGQSPDFTFNKNTGQITTTDPLSAGDKLTAGSAFTRAKVISTPLPSGPALPGKIWMILDGEAESIPNSLLPATQMEFNKSGNILTITAQTAFAVPQGFDLAIPGDWLLIWSNPGDPAPLIANSGFWRVETSQVGQLTVDDGATSRSNLGTLFLPPNGRVLLVRSAAPIQLLDFNANTLVDSAADIQSKLSGANVDITGASIRISTQTFDSTGEIFIVAADAGGNQFQFPLGTAIDNVPSHYGFIVTSDSEAGLPSFTYSTIGTVINDHVFDEANYETIGGTRDDFVQFLDFYNAGALSIVPNNNRGQRAFVSKYDPVTDQLTIDTPIYMQAGKSIINAGDRYFLRTSYQFDSNDFATVIVDGNEVTEAFTMPVARRLAVSSNSAPSQNDFSATDLQSSLALSNLSSFFGFNFADFKAWRQAQAELTDGVYDLLFKAFDFGPIGNNFRIGFVYPTSSSQSTLSSEFNHSELIDIGIVLPVTATRTPSWDNTSAFTVAVTTVGGLDQVTYTWRVGTKPDFSIAQSNVQIGDIAIINGGAQFLPGDSGISNRVSALTPQTFTLQRPTGQAVNDNMQFASMVNQNGTISITTGSPHNINQGSLIGIWNTASPDGGSTFPMNSTYIANVTGPSSFTVPTTVGTPGGGIQSGTQVGSVITLVTVNPHGVQAGDIILVSGVGTGSYDGLVAVLNTIGPNQIQYVKSGSSAPISNIGRFDFQSFAPTVTTAITDIAKAGTLVTVHAIAHGLSPAELVQIQNVTIDPWSNVTAYNIGDIARDGANNYVATVANTGNQPSLTPADWSVTSLDLGGIFVVNTVGDANHFTYYYQESGITSGTGGTSTAYETEGSLARTLSGIGSTNLAFVQASTTAQAVVDFVATNMSTQITAALGNAAPNAPITMSTEDQGLAGNYYSGNVTNIAKTIASRKVKFTVNQIIPAGATITVSGLSGGNSAYNGTYSVIESEISGGNTILTVQSDVFAGATSSSGVSGTFTASLPYIKMVDGENDINTSNVSAPLNTPMFTLKIPWATTPAINEEIRLMATNSDQLVRFWSELIVTGFTNVGQIANSEYGRQIELSTQTFGGSGSVQVAGGSANALTMALVGSANSVDDRYGIFNVPYEIRRGLVPRQWVNLQNQIRQNKQLAFSDTTTVQVFNNGMSITSGSGTFQTLRATTQDATTEFKIEKHGAFVAFIGVAGTSMGLISAGVKEGDWVRFKDTVETAWSILTAYTTGQRVNFNNVNYTALNNNTGNQPDLSPTHWQRQEFLAANTGIFQVVRVFGDNSFWIKFDNVIEELMILGNPLNLAFYSYDSVMPGDTLVISTDALGVQNQGRFTVVDESFGVGFFFPTSTRIWTKPIPVANPPTLLANNAALVNVEEANLVSIWKRILSIGPGPTGYANILTDSPELMSKISSSLGSFLVGQGKLAFDQHIHFGIDSYKNYLGLIKQLNRVIYGDPADPINYPGWRAAGTAIDIKPAIIKRILIGVAIRVISGVPFNAVREQVQASIAGYINTLGVGAQVSLSSVVSAAQTVNGVLSVAITSPTYDAANDLISIGADQEALVVDSTTDITVSIIGQ